MERYVLTQGADGFFLSRVCGLTSHVTHPHTAHVCVSSSLSDSADGQTGSFGQHMDKESSVRL